MHYCGGCARGTDMEVRTYLARVLFVKYFICTVKWN